MDSKKKKCCVHLESARTESNLGLLTLCSVLFFHLWMGKSLFGYHRIGYALQLLYSRNKGWVWPYLLDLSKDPDFSQPISTAYI